MVVIDGTEHYKGIIAPAVVEGAGKKEGAEVVVVVASLHFTG